jgi:hypothetical protein
MPAFSPTQLNYRARNANSVTIMIGDIPVAFAQTVSHSFDMGTQALYGVGTAKPQEIQQLQFSPQVTLDNFALTSVGELLLDGGNDLVPLLTFNQFNISIADGTTNSTLYTYMGCTASNFAENIPTNQVITDAITFLAMDVYGSTGQSILNSNSVLNTAAAGIGTLTSGGLGL